MALSTNYLRIGLNESYVKIGAVLKKVKGIKTLTVDPETWSSRAEGDNTAIGAISGFTGFGKGTAEFCVCDMDTIAFLCGETAVLTGATPNQVSTLSFHGTRQFPEFSIEGRTTNMQAYGTGTLPADSHLKVHHCRLTKAPIPSGHKMNKEGYQVFSFEFDCWADNTTDHIFDMIDYETATVIT
jgi:hypothetical protein